MSGLRLAVYTDYAYRRQGDAVFGERAFVVFLSHLAERLERMVVIGRLDPSTGSSHYRLPPQVDFVPLPHYESQVQPLRLSASLARSVRRFWRTLPTVDGVLLLGPHPVALAFAAAALARRKPVVLGVRQELPAYARARHPGRRWTHVAADLLDSIWRLLGRHLGVVVVGPALARAYRRAPHLLELCVSLVREAEIASDAAAEARPYDGRLQALSVGRLETEKNPTLLADVLAAVRQRDPRWHLVVCGEGPLAQALERRLQDAGVADHAELRGYVPIDGGLRELYTGSHAFLHVSLTEGLPQVLFESFAAGLPVVATDVGGVGDATGEAALLVPPGDARAAAAALERVAHDGTLRRGLVRAGLATARRHTMESETARLVRFLAGELARQRR